ncbi:MAG: hypothetical protein L0H84_14355 [Pseudonocardia sp.]|nr:hypothetical protein [Pseudonocardia sp.]
MPARPSHDHPLDDPHDPDAALSPAEPAPTNRASRRAGSRSRAGQNQVPDQARYQPPAHSRPAQGRRINPVRRTG